MQWGSSCFGSEGGEGRELEERGREERGEKSELAAYNDGRAGRLGTCKKGREL